MNDEDDQRWLDTLAGRRAPSDTATAREAVALRRALLARSITEADGAVSDATRVEALLARARHEGVLRERRPHAQTWLFGWRGAMVLAAVGGLAIGVGLIDLPINTGDADETVRSVDRRPFVLMADDPVALEMDLIDALEAAGLAATGYKHFGRRGIDADLPDPVPATVAAVLARYGVPLPPDRVLRIEIVEREP